MNAALPCENFGEFKKALNTLRTKDDKVIYGLNRLLPTASFKDKVVSMYSFPRYFHSDYSSVNLASNLDIAVDLSLFIRF